MELAVVEVKRRRERKKKTKRDRKKKQVRCFLNDTPKVVFSSTGDEGNFLFDAERLGRERRQEAGGRREKD